MSAVDDSSYDALTQLRKEKPLPPKYETSHKPHTTAVSYSWGGRERLILKVKIGKHCCWISCKKLLIYSKIKSTAAKEQISKRSDARKTHHSSKDTYHGLNEKPI